RDRASVGLRMPPPRLPGPTPTPAWRAWKRAAAFARASSIALIALATLSTLINILHPLSAHFLISILALGNGIAEWRFGRSLHAGEPRATAWLAWNQVILGAGVLAYGLSQARV